jgi:hypothetical protein
MSFTRRDTFARRVIAEWAARVKLAHPDRQPSRDAMTSTIRVGHRGFQSVEHEDFDVDGHLPARPGG